MAKEKPNANETPRSRFLRLAPSRIEAALKKISLLGNLARAGYEYEPDEVKQMLAALDNAVDDIRQKFTKTPGKTKTGGFSFKHRSAA
jgi:hypothetical protein